MTPGSAAAQAIRGGGMRRRICRGGVTTRSVLVVDRIGQDPPVAPRYDEVLESPRMGK